jgi:hypothetical protein
VLPATNKRIPETALASLDEDRTSLAEAVPTPATTAVAPSKTFAVPAETCAVSMSRSTTSLAPGPSETARPDPSSKVHVSTAGIADGPAVHVHVPAGWLGDPSPL